MGWLRSGLFADKPHPKTGATALHVATSKGYNRLIGMLIKAGASVHTRFPFFKWKNNF
jgi:ankyrin repeat protein